MRQSIGSICRFHLFCALIQPFLSRFHPAPASTGCQMRDDSPQIVCPRAPPQQLFGVRFQWERFSRYELAGMGREGFGLFRSHARKGSAHILRPTAGIKFDFGEEKKKAINGIDRRERLCQTILRKLRGTESVWVYSKSVVVCVFLFQTFTVNYFLLNALHLKNSICRI
ncbi:hypothetical protein NPIL_171661 [Nephila pilipes]|uniref:Uncharacterized protein n=1 Tax=Nephila pilipes TaxID=299642 RepID=A0A8X6MXR7_NEPPI|nr:hypothetical protein NPIL_171661 [Nephila pilipes]